MKQGWVLRLLDINNNPGFWVGPPVYVGPLNKALVFATKDAVPEPDEMYAEAICKVEVGTDGKATKII